jgi:MFS family permease
MNEGTLTALAENEKGSVNEVTLKTIVEKEDEERQSMIRYKFQNVEETVHTEQGTTFFAKFMKYQKVYNIFVLALSSISFGFGLSSYDIMRNVMSPENDGLQQSVFNFLSTFAISNIFLGGLIANFLVRAFPRIKRKHLLMISSAANCFAYAFQFMIPRIITVAITRIFIGIASGIVCAVVPGFLKDNAPKKLSGFIPSIHAIGISLGIMIGGLFGMMNDSARWHIPMWIAVFYFLVNAVLIFFMKDQEKEQEELIEHIGLFPMLRMKDARKSLLTCTLFHLTQHLSGTDFVAMFSARVMGHLPNYSIIYISSMACAIPVGLASSFLLDKVGRKPMMLISCSLLVIVTLLMGSVDWYTVLVYFFVISYNIGVANVPWTLPTEIFPKNCFKTGNMIGITVNWFSGYLLAICAGVIYEAFGDYLWYFFSASMLIVSLYTGFMLKETKGITVPQFQ